MLMAVEILAVVACAAASGVTSFAILERREARQFAASRAEELYTLIEAFDQGIVGFFENAFTTHPDACPYQVSDAGLAGLMRDSARARMLISFYFPALWPKVRRADAAVAAGVAALRRYHANPRGEAPGLSLEPALADLRHAMESLKHAVVTTHRDGAARRLRRRLLGPSRTAALAA
jgi:hypothetical protein